MERDASPAGQGVRRRAGLVPTGHAAPAAAENVDRPMSARAQGLPSDFAGSVSTHASERKTLSTSPKSAASAGAGEAPDWFERNETATAVIVFVIALISRFYRLDQPRGVVFDETHFGKFTNWYTENRFFFDIHPPLGKLTFWAAGKLLGYDASKCEFVDLNRPYWPECRYYILRSVAATFSTLTVLLMFYAARNFGCRVKGAAVAALLLVFDMVSVGEGRLILMDSQLIFWLLATLLVAQQWWKALNRSDEAAGLVPTGAAAGRALGVLLQPGEAAAARRAVAGTAASAPLTPTQRLLWCVAVGIACGNAINIKMTGLVTPAAIALESFFGAWFLHNPVPFHELLLVLLSAMLTYSWWFAVSFWLFVNTGPNKVEQEFMTPLFQATLVGSDNYDPTGRALADWRSSEGFWWTMITHNARMIKHNANILAPHPWQSTWWEWLIDARGVAYYGQDTGHRYHTQIYLLGNAAVFWSVLAALGVAVLALTYYGRYRRAFHPSSDVHAFAKQAVFCIVAYCMNLAPYLGVARSTFLYHYMPALVYGQILTSRVIEVCVPSRWHYGVQATLLLVVVAVYLHFAAWIYGLPLTQDAHDRRRWMPRWN